MKLRFIGYIIVMILSLWDMVGDIIYANYFGTTFNFLLAALSYEFAKEEYHMLKED
jgi:hypothetical protein